MARKLLNLVVLSIQSYSAYNVHIYNSHLMYLFVHFSSGHCRVCYEFLQSGGVSHAKERLFLIQGSTTPRQGLK